MGADLETTRCVLEAVIGGASKEAQSLVRKRPALQVNRRGIPSAAYGETHVIEAAAANSCDSGAFAMEHGHG